MSRKIIVCVLLLCIIYATGAFATDLTVFSVSDTHFTKNAIASDLCKAGIQAMNTLPGMPYPTEFGNTAVSTPSAVLACGDLCDGGSAKWGWATDTPECNSKVNYQDEWNGFDYYFPPKGVLGDYNRLKYPTYATAGNHDWWRYRGWDHGTSCYVANKLKARYCSNCNSAEGNVCYSFDLDGIHFASLGRYPDQHVIDWLKSDLAAVGPYKPVVLFQHYDFKSPNKWWKDCQRKSLADVVDGYKIIAILHGHSHNAKHYTWNGYDIYDDGTLSMKGDIGVLHITDSYVDFAEYRVTCDNNGNLTGGSWQWSYRKSR
ncbi:MAG: metallophosphoesterase [Armatimonadota bacterium]